MTSPVTRRRLLGLLAIGSGIALAGCNARSAPATAEKEAGGAGVPKATDDTKRMLVYRDPECGCCEAWADIARKAGYLVTVENRGDMAAIKRRYKVPEELASCHTAIVAGYAIEGHVPMEHVAKLVADRPRDILGIAVPGMPRGSPGMEMPDGAVDPFKVLAFGAKGQVHPFAA